MLQTQKIQSAQHKHEWISDDNGNVARCAICKIEIEATPEVNC